MAAEEIKSASDYTNRKQRSPFTTLRERERDREGTHSGGEKL